MKFVVITGKDLAPVAKVARTVRAAGLLGEHDI
jgi:hypothetical protein